MLCKWRHESSVMMPMTLRKLHVQAACSAFLADAPLLASRVPAPQLLPKVFLHRISVAQADVNDGSAVQAYWCVLCLMRPRLLPRPTQLQRACDCKYVMRPRLSLPELPLCAQDGPSRRCLPVTTCARTISRIRFRWLCQRCGAWTRAGSCRDDCVSRGCDAW